jgi:hypothetical protein
MKIAKSILKAIIKEELNIVLREDIKARTAALDAKRQYDKLKVAHREARDDLLEIAEALELVMEVTQMAKDKGTEVFPRPGARKPTPYGLETTDYTSLELLATIAREEATRLAKGSRAPMPPKVPPVNELENRTTSLHNANEKVRRVLNEMDKLKVEKVDTTTRGGPSKKMAFDAYMDKGYNDSFSGTRPILEQHAYYIHDAIRTLPRNPIRSDVREELYRYSKKGFLKNMAGSKEIRK